MNHDEFERFVLKFGKDILRFCRIINASCNTLNTLIPACSASYLSQPGIVTFFLTELYQDTMLKLLEKKKRLDSAQNTKSYALSTSIYLWKNKNFIILRRKRKYSAFTATIKGTNEYFR